ncbi:hypothetical protein A0256_14010 [Mucilaginibacter sp. PAMC 26640]|nr:hypothetical protein A0256_14010 [Mucilaginibacter sp. PAMC 26640]
MTLQNGVLLLRDRRPEEIINHAIDIFFTSLALDANERAIGMILSGGGNDGLSGSKKIGESKGFDFIKYPYTAE